MMIDATMPPALIGTSRMSGFVAKLEMASTAELRDYVLGVETDEDFERWLNAITTAQSTKAQGGDAAEVAAATRASVDEGDSFARA